MHKKITTFSSCEGTEKEENEGEKIKWKKRLLPFAPAFSTSPPPKGGAHRLVPPAAVRSDALARLKHPVTAHIHSKGAKYQRNEMFYCTNFVVDAI